MEETTVATPDGGEIIVQHPKGATNEQIISFAIQQYQQQEASEPDTPSPATEDTSWRDSMRGIYDPLLQGATFGFSDEIEGVLRGGFGEGYEAARDAARARADYYRERNPALSTAAEIAGGLVTGGLGAARAGAFQAAKAAPTFLGKMKPVISTGAVQGGLYGAGKSEEGTIGGTAKAAAQGAAMGAATAPILPAVASGLRGGAKRVFQTQSDSPIHQRAVKLLKDKVGINTLTTGQKTGSLPMRAAETTQAETLVGANLARRLQENRGKLQTKLMKMAGFDMNQEDAALGLITEEALDAASTKFSSKYSQMLKGKQLDFAQSNNFINKIAEIQGRAQSKITIMEKKQVQEIVNDVFDEITEGPVGAQRYNQLRSDLARLARNNANRPNIAKLYTDLKNALDDEVADQLGLGQAKRLLDTQYNRFVKIRDTYKQTRSIPGTRGYLPIGTLLGKSSAVGKGTDAEFREIVRAGQAVLGDPVANSATASRLANMAILGEGAATATGMIDPTMGAATLGVPWAAGQALARGFTGSPTADKLISAGLLTVPTTQQGLIAQQ